MRYVVDSLERQYDLTLKYPGRRESNYSSWRCMYLYPFFQWAKDTETHYMFYQEPDDPLLDFLTRSQNEESEFMIYCIASLDNIFVIFKTER